MARIRTTTIKVSGPFSLAAAIDALDLMAPHRGDGGALRGLARDRRPPVQHPRAPGRAAAAGAERRRRRASSARTSTPPSARAAHVRARPGRRALLRRGRRRRPRAAPPAGAAARRAAGDGADAAGRARLHRPGRPARRRARPHGRRPPGRRARRPPTWPRCDAHADAARLGLEPATVERLRILGQRGAERRVRRRAAALDAGRRRPPLDLPQRPKSAPRPPTSC